MKLVSIWALAALCLCLGQVASSEKLLNCYWGTWANYRPGDGKFTPSDIDPSLCTHISYTFFGISDAGEFKSLDTWLDMDDGLGFISQTIALKQRNPNLKILAVVGGWNEGSTKYSAMAADPAKRATFVSTSLAFIQQYGFDGLDLDWEYPGQRGGSEADRENFVTLLREIKETYDQYGLELGIAVGASEKSASISYDIPAISQHLTFINVMTYDFHMALDGYLGLNAPLPEVAESIDYWLSHGAPAEKLILGIGFYGHSYQMSDSSQNWPGAACIGPGSAGVYTRENGFLGYHEICLNNWQTVFDQENGAPYAFQGDQWIGYDNPESIQLKMQLVESRNLGGAMMWSIETDDFRGLCGESYPLLKTMNRALGREVNGGGGGGGGGAGVGGHQFSFASPTAAPSGKEANSASNSSTSSEASNSSQQNNGWSFEEQFKQVRQLYEINDDPKRKEFLDDLFSFMQKRGTPINRLPIMAKSVLDLYELYNLVIARGGLVDVINKKLWQEIIKGLHLPSSITSAAFTLRTQYMKYLYPYECEKKNLSTPAELQAAIDGNRREGRRSSYGQYEAMHNQMPMTPISRPSLPGGMQQMSPLALVTHAAVANNQQAQAAAAAAAAHHRLMGAPAFGQMPNLVKQEIESRMMEYLQLIQAKKEQGMPPVLGANHPHQQQHSQQQQHHHQQQQQSQQQHHLQQQRQRSQSPDLSKHEALSAQVALWHMYHNNNSPPGSAHTSPQQREALNLSDSPPNLTNIKREREREPTPEPVDQDDKFVDQPPPAKRVGSGLLPPGFPANFYLNPHNMAAVAAAAGFHHPSMGHQQDAASEGEPEDDYAHGEHNTTGNSSSMHDDSEPQQMNGHHHHHQTHHLDKSDDSAIENSPTTSTTTGGSVGHRHSSPVSTKKKGGSKPQSGGKDLPAEDKDASSSGKLNPLETLSLLSGMQFQVARNGTGDNGEPQLIVNLELNGVKYSGVLVANVPLSESETRTSSPCHAEAPTAEEEKDEEEEEPKAAEEESHRSPVKQENEDADQDMEGSEVLLNGGASAVGGAAAGVGVGVPLLKDAVVS